MKTKIFIAIIIISIAFITGGFYIHNSIESVNSRLEKIITLQHVGILREKTLHSLKVVQADLLLKDSPYSRNLDDFVAHVENLDETSQTCISCHHYGAVEERIRLFVNDVTSYKKKLSRVYTIRANSKRLDIERENAHQTGEHITRELNDMILTASFKLTKRIELARQDIADTKFSLLLLLILGPFFVMLVTAFFLRKFTDSVAVLLKANRKIKDGDLQYRIKEELQYEFKELSTGFNDMAGSLNEQCSRMQNAERLAVVGELAAGLAHEIRNPLAGIKLSTQYLGDKLTLDEKQKRIFQEMTKEMDRVEGLLQSLLNYAKPPEPNLTNININSVLETALRSTQLSFKSPDKSEQKKDISLIKETDQNLPPIMADPSQLLQVFLNLLLNAVDAITEKGTITAKTTTDEEGSVVLEISDDGPGADEEKLEQIFKPFFTTKSHGTGLGLAICKRLIEQQQGSIEVARNQNRGLTFRIKFPPLS